ncbi:sulfur carrier protein ThiS [Parvularcula lutaonensis]|uniref:Sulfur carrier protein ThiS n=1 Tax=Parvularcula lutaonensis TaxID=491923 RepID=A0ABV7M989_9PROT|nr:sulfur carrier protein ThiS [Parvularcula lutaonensis]
MSKTNDHKDLPIAVTVNGETRAMPLGTSVADLLAHLGIVGGKVAVERNRAIVARSSFDTQMLQDGDVIEIVRFVGGG